MSSPRARLFVGDNLRAIERLREEHVVVDLVYVDPPFGTGVKHGARTKKGESRASIATLGYDDAWEDIDRFCASLRERIAPMHTLLSPCASFYLHLDHRAVHEAKLICDDVMGRHAFRGEIIWVPGNGARSTRAWGASHQTILVYTRDDREKPQNPRWIFRTDDALLREPYAAGSSAQHFKDRGDGKRVRERTINGKTYRYDLDRGRRIGTVWVDIPAMAANTPLSPETTGYPHQKPEKLLSRIIEASSEPASLVADFFCGSGTTIVSAVKSGRSAIGCDASPLAIEVTSKRLRAIGIEPIVEEV